MVQPNLLPQHRSPPAWSLGLLIGPVELLIHVLPVANPRTDGHVLPVGLLASHLSLDCLH